MDRSSGAGSTPQHRIGSGFGAHGQAKTASSLFAVELDRRGRTAGVRSFRDIAELTIPGAATALTAGVDPRAVDPEVAAGRWAPSADLTAVNAFG
ncbi:hypothetical protein IV498_08500 [Paenarthrobacter sp. Z7-10]|uniref:hypothetical protein n=1 Tax=Paenarthrobacter sp. Z7-10 TaxID=2787635 RepID=UPI0022A94F2B|nr:hypothetical protein [Paenarthrobacter sp. Z7-10]MCZ2403220.1 hypothetical protein [Paenarthrobacter sp. Z7-10]